MKRLVIALMLIAAFAFTAYADGPPPNGYWGEDFSNWETYTVPYASGHTLWSTYATPEAWHSYENGYFGVQYPPFSIDFYNELSMIETLDWTHVVVHRTGNVWDAVGTGNETIDLIVTGTLRSNHKMWIGVEPLTQAQRADLDVLKFQHKVVAGATGTYPDINVAWWYRYGLGMTVDPNYSWRQDWVNTAEGYLWLIDPCDHWFQLKCSFVIPYHQTEGHWTMQGYGCPAPEL